MELVTNPPPFIGDYLKRILFDGLHICSECDGSGYTTGFRRCNACEGRGRIYKK